MGYRSVCDLLVVNRMHKMTKKNKNVDPFERYKKEYWKASKQRKSEIIKIVRELTHMHNKSIVRKFHRLQVKDPSKKDYRGRPLLYTKDCIAALKSVWNISGELCAELLHPTVAMYVEELMEAKKWAHGDIATGKLYAMSMGTVKNKIAQFNRIKRKGKGISTTKPSHIKFIVKVFTGPWRNKPLGYGQTDTVVHSGSALAGNMAYTLNFTEMQTIWICLRAQMNKGEVPTKESMEHIRSNMLPVEMTGIHPDTGSEFLNWHLKGWCDKHKIDFTRSRAGEKNDNMLVEERNGHVVRKVIGYIRISCVQAVKVLNELYEVECLIHNHFTPVRKTVEKIRIGAKMRRKHDTAQTPYQRMMCHKDTPKEVRARLKDEHESLSLVELRKQSAILKRRVYETQKRYGDRLW